MPSNSMSLATAAAAKIKTKHLNNSSFFKASLKINNKALAVDLAAQKMKNGRLQMRIVKLQKQIEAQGFYIATMRHKERKLMLFLKDINTLYDVGMTTDLPDDSNRLRRMSQKFPQSASSSGSNSAAEQENTMLLDTDMELTASDTITIHTVEPGSKKNDTQVGNSGTQSKTLTDQGGICAARNPETQRKPTGTFLQTDNYTEEVQPCVQRRLIPCNPKLRQPQACVQRKMVKDNNACCGLPEMLAISAISNLPNIVIPVLDVMDPVTKSSRAKESATHLSEREILEDSGTPVPSREAVLPAEAIPGAIPAEAFPERTLKSITNTTTARDKRERRRTGAHSSGCRERFVVPPNHGCSSPNGVPAIVLASTIVQEDFIPGYVSHFQQSETVGNANVGNQHCEQNLPAFPALEETRDTFTCSAEAGVGPHDGTPLDVSFAELDRLISVPKRLTSASETVYKGPVVPDEASPGRENEDIATDDGALRPRRSRVTINYKEPSLNRKMRRGETTSKNKPKKANSKPVSRL